MQLLSSLTLSIYSRRETLRDRPGRKAVKGVYILLAELREDSVVKTLRREFILSKGFYVYVGSAMNNLEARVNRHLSRTKRRHWHIDFLLDQARLTNTYWAQTTSKKECQLANQFAAMKSIEGFGCSDCHCPSHLFYNAGEDSLRNALIKAFNAIGLEAIEKPI
jgi:Uri superfamily endonuclease